MKADRRSVISAIGMIVLCTIVFIVMGVGMAEEPTQRKLTLMVYMCGSNLESQYGLASEDIEEMLASGVNDQEVSVLVMTGGSTNWRTRWGAGKNNILKIGNQKLHAVWPISSEESNIDMNMGDGNTLSFFLNFCRTYYPAENYALIFWDHGGGPLEGVCFDELFHKDQSLDALDLGEIRKALNDSPFDADHPLEWIGFDACLMASVETAHICAPYAKYMIASQETEPGTGWDYGFLKHISDNSQGYSTGQSIIECYVNGNDSEDEMRTLSCVELSRIDALEDAMNELFVDLDQMLETSYFADISNGRMKTKNFGRSSTYSDYDLVDLFSLSDHYSDIAPAKAHSLQKALEDAVVFQAGNQENSHGLSVYFPYFNKEYYQSVWNWRYRLWGFANQYCRFMNHYADIWLGDAMADWSGMEAEAHESRWDGQEITLPLTQDQAEHFAFAQVYILEKFPVQNSYYYKIDEINDVALDSNGVLHAKYNYKSLYVVDDKGNPLFDSIPYRIIDGYYFIRANLSDKTYMAYWNELFPGAFSVNNDATMNARKVYLKCLPNKEGDGLKVVGVIDMGKDLGEGPNGLLNEGKGLFSGKQMISVEDEEWNWIWFFHYPREKTEYSGDNILPFDKWYDPNENIEGRICMEWEEIDNHKSWELKFLEHRYSGENLYAQYIIHDSQGNLAGSNLIPVANPNVIHVAEINETVFVSDLFSLDVKSIDLAKAEFDDGLYLYLDVVDPVHNDINNTIQIDNIILNQCMLDHSYTLHRIETQNDQNGYVLNIPSRDLPASLEEELTSIRFDVAFVDMGTGIVLNKGTVELLKPVNIGFIHSFVPEKKEMANAKAKGFSWRLLDMEEDDDYLTLTLRIENTYAKEQKVDCGNTVVVNDCVWEQALEGLSFSIPANCWTIHKAKIRKHFPAERIKNRYESLQFSYPEYWGIKAIESIVFFEKDNENEVFSFDLYDPFKLKEDRTSKYQATSHLYSGEKRSEVTGIHPDEKTEKTDSKTLLNTEDICVTLKGVSVHDIYLILALDITNKSSRDIEILPQYCTVNGVACDCNICPSDSSFSVSFSTETIQARRRKRMDYKIKYEDIRNADINLKKIEVGFEYCHKGDPVWFYCSAAKLNIEELPSLNQIGMIQLPMSSIVVSSESILLDHDQVDPMSLISVTTDLSGDFQTYQTKLHVHLSDTQAMDYESATVKMMLPYEERKPEQGEYLRYIIELTEPVTLENSNELVCDFNGLLLGAKGISMPLAQKYTVKDTEYTYKIAGVSVKTDHADLFSEALFEDLLITFNRDCEKGEIANTRLSRAIGKSEKTRTMSCWTKLHIYADNTAVKETKILVGESCSLYNKPVQLILCPAERYDPIVLFCVHNHDGGEYVLKTSYQQATITK